MCVMSLGLFLRDGLFAAETLSARRFSVQLAQCKAQGVSPGFRPRGWARDEEEDGGKALNARQEEDGRQKPIRQPESRVPPFSQLFRPLEDQDTARNECEKKQERVTVGGAHQLLGLAVARERSSMSACSQALKSPGVLLSDSVVARLVVDSI